MVGWHHRLNGHGFWWTLGVGDAQGGLACCSPWGHKELDMTKQLNLTDLYLRYIYRYISIYGYMDIYVHIYTYICIYMYISNMDKVSWKNLNGK